MNRYGLRILAVAASLILPPAAIAALQQVNGIDVVIDPPPGFEQSPAFSGFQNVSAYSTIEVRQVDLPIGDIVAQLSDGGAGIEGYTIIEKKALRIDERDAILLHLEASSDQAAFNKWVLMLGDAFRSITVTASYPKLAANEMSQPLKQSLLTTRWLRTPKQQLFYDLPFTVNESKDLKYARRTQNMLVLADTQQTGSLSTLSPSVVVGHLSSETDLTDIKALSHRQLTELNSIEIVSIDEEGETRVDGIRAYRIRAKARPRGGDNSLIFEQVIAIQPRKYLLVQSAVEESKAERYLPQFAEVVESIKFKLAQH